MSLGGDVRAASPTKGWAGGQALQPGAGRGARGGHQAATDRVSGGDVVDQTGPSSPLAAPPRGEEGK